VIIEERSIMLYTDDKNRSTGKLYYDCS